jgi:hypothetical protein
LETAVEKIPEKRLRRDEAVAVDAAREIIVWAARSYFESQGHEGCF